MAPRSHCRKARPSKTQRPVSEYTGDRIRKGVALDSTRTASNRMKTRTHFTITNSDRRSTNRSRNPAFVKLAYARQFNRTNHGNAPAVQPDLKAWPGSAIIIRLKPPSVLLS